MIWFYAFIIISLCYIILIYSRWIWSMNTARREGHFPLENDMTMYDVRRLLLKGNKDAAIRAYSKIFKTNIIDARKNVEELEKSIQENNSGLE